MTALTKGLTRKWEEQNRSGIGHATAKAPMGVKENPLTFSVPSEREMNNITSTFEFRQ